jgi:predicted XRE-type DNA-binding protein
MASIGRGAREIRVHVGGELRMVYVAEAERLSIQSGLALALEREIETRKWTQAEAARRIGITQPRVNDLLRGRLDKFSIDTLIVYLVRVGVPVRIDTSTPKRRRRAA